MTSFALRGLMILFLAASPALAGMPTIDPGIVWLLPNKSDQDIGLYVTGGDEVEAFNLYVQVADGGPEMPDYISDFDPDFVGIDGPEITALDLITGTIFESNHSEHSVTPSLPQYRDASISTAWETGDPDDIRTVRTSGPLGDSDPALIATITFDTTGWMTGTWDLMLIDTFGGMISSDFTLAPSNISNGEIRIVPEPSSLLLLSMGAVGLLLLSVFKRRR